MSKFYKELHKDKLAKQSMRFLTQGLNNVATRINNAEDSFITFAMEQGSMSRPEAIKVLNTYRKIKAIKIDAVGGQFTLTHGIFAESDVLRKAITFYEK